MNEPCDGFDERRGRPFPPCRKGLNCEPRGGNATFVPGADKVCTLPKGSMLFEQGRRQSLRGARRLQPPG